MGRRGIVCCREFPEWGQKAQALIVQNPKAAQRRKGGAKGADQSCGQIVILTSQRGASQPIGECTELGSMFGDSLNGTGSPTLSRRLFMNMLVSSAAIAAAPAVAAPQESAPRTSEIATDHKAVLERMEQVVDVLRTRHIRPGWTLSADRAAAYFRRHVRGPSFRDEDEDTEEFHHAAKFLHAHGQSIYWVLFGDPSFLICGLAASCCPAEHPIRRKRRQTRSSTLSRLIKKASADYSAAIRDLVPGTLDPDPEKEETFGDREAEVRHELATSVPTTLAGLLAVLT